MCTVQPDSKQPTYDKLTQEQWVQGVFLCILEEPETVKRDKMLQYYVLLMQDGVELNFPTVKRAHAAVIQEIEKGKLNWEQSEEIEKTKTGTKPEGGGSATVQTCTHFNKGFVE